MLAVLRGGGQMTAAAIGQALGLDRIPVSKALNRLRTRGLVRIAAYEHHARSWGNAGLPGVWEAVPAP